MTNRSLALLALAIGMTACTGTPASGPRASGPTYVTPLMLEPPPVYALLGFRERLNLTSPQITRLDSIATAVHDRNAPLIDSLQAHSMEARSQAAWVAQDSTALLALREIRANNRSAAQAVGMVLDSIQQTTACDIFNEQDRDRLERRRAMQGRSMNDRPMTRRQREQRADSLDALIPGRVWPWCGKTDERVTG